MDKVKYLVLMSVCLILIPSSVYGHKSQIQECKVDKTNGNQEILLCQIGRQPIGEIQEINDDWEIIVLKIGRNPVVRVGSILTVQGKTKLHFLTVKRISYEKASAAIDSIWSEVKDLQKGNLVYLYNPGGRSV